MCLAQLAGTLPRHVEAAQQLGVRFALDDVGAGYSPMTHLRRLPLSVVRVDRSFVTAPAQESADARLGPLPDD